MIVKEARVLKVGITIFIDGVVSENSNRPAFMPPLGSSSEAIRLTAHDIPRSLRFDPNSGSMLQNSDLLLQAVDHDHVLLLLVVPAYQRHQHQSEYVHFRFLQSPIEEMQREILFHN